MNSPGTGAFSEVSRAGIGSISHDFYPGGRHEMLNEINSDEVRTRLLGWISSVLEQRKVAQAAS